MFQPMQSTVCCPGKETVKPQKTGVPLCLTKAGARVKVACVKGDRKLCARMASLGIYPGVEVELLCQGCGHPCLVRVNGGTLSLGGDISGKILVTPSP